MLGIFKYGYMKYSKYIHNQIQHIERIHNDGIITSHLRMQYLRQISELIKTMNNDVYNKNIKNYTDDDSSDELYKCDDIKMWEMINIHVDDDYPIHEYNCVKNKLLDICAKTGFYSLQDAFELLSILTDVSSNNFNELFNTFNTAFVPINYKLEILQLDNNNNIREIKGKQYINDSEVV